MKSKTKHKRRRKKTNGWCMHSISYLMKGYLKINKLEKKNHEDSFFIISLKQNTQKIYLNRKTKMNKSIQV